MDIKISTSLLMLASAQFGLINFVDSKVDNSNTSNFCFRLNWNSSCVTKKEREKKIKQIKKHFLYLKKKKLRIFYLPFEWKWMANKFGCCLKGSKTIKNLFDRIHTKSVTSDKNLQKCALHTRTVTHISWVFKGIIRAFELMNVCMTAECMFVCTSVSFLFFFTWKANPLPITVKLIPSSVWTPSHQITWTHVKKRRNNDTGDNKIS